MLQQLRIVADAGHAVVFGAVVAGLPAGVKGVVFGAVGVEARTRRAAKDAGKATQPAGPSRCTSSHNFLTVSPFAPLFINDLEGRCSRKFACRMLHSPDPVGQNFRARTHGVGPDPCTLLHDRIDIR